MNAPPPARVGSVEAKPVAQDAHRLQAQLSREREDVLLLLLDEVGARLGMLPRREPVAQRPHPPADAIARLDDGDGRAAGLERPCRRQSRQPGSRDDDARPGQIAP